MTNALDGRKHLADHEPYTGLTLCGKTIYRCLLPDDAPACQECGDIQDVQLAAAPQPQEGT